MMAFGITQRPVARVKALASHGVRAKANTGQVGWRFGSRVSANIGSVPYRLSPFARVSPA